MTEQGVYSRLTRTPLKDASSWEQPRDGREIGPFDVFTQLVHREWLIAAALSLIKRKLLR